jgi:mitogen-activated protein kinase kinase kinase
MSCLNSIQALKAASILVEVTGVCKIAGFGISMRTVDDGVATAMQGTVFWMSPEFVNPQGKGYNSKVDIWALGCVILEMWTGVRPWHGEEAVSVMFKVRSQCLASGDFLLTFCEKLSQQKLPPPVPDGMVLSELADDLRRKFFAM